MIWPSIKSLKPLLHRACLTACLFCTTLLPGFAVSSDFEIFKYLSLQNSAKAYLEKWGRPDSFMLSFVGGGKSCRRIELWVYAKQGVEVMFENGERVKDFLFNPKAGKAFSASSNLDPGDFSRETSLEEIKKRFGQAKRQHQSEFAERKAEFFEYENGSSKTFIFVDGALSFVSAGLAEEQHNPWVEGSQNSAVAVSDPSALIGNWQSNLGTLSFKRAALNPKYLEGSFRPAIALWGLPPNEPVGIISQGSYEKDGDLVKITINNLNAHAELKLSPDKKNLIGGLFIKGSSFNRWILKR
ncbi:MAG: hypothetical protein K2X27_17200 [Candidatus Obscuribacterales bacterium]|nr:hypothetical protein [Candidatus Obscuribacterales bacterium]